MQNAVELVMPLTLGECRRLLRCQLDRPFRSRGKCFSQGQDFCIGGRPRNQLSVVFQRRLKARAFSAVASIPEIDIRADNQRTGLTGLRGVHVRLDLVNGANGQGLRYGDAGAEYADRQKYRQSANRRHRAASDVVLAMFAGVAGRFSPDWFRTGVHAAVVRPGCSAA